MSALPIITEITDQGITARIEGDEIALSPPKGTLTPEVLADACPWCFNRLRGLPMPNKHDLDTKRLEHQLEALRERSK